MALLEHLGWYTTVRDKKWAPSSECVSSSIPSWQILTAHTQPFRGARDLAFCLKVPLDWLLVWASSEGSGETPRMRRIAWTFAARIGDKYQIRLTRSIYVLNSEHTIAWIQISDILFIPLYVGSGDKHNKKQQQQKKNNKKTKTKKNNNNKFCELYLGCHRIKELDSIKQLTIIV